MYATCKDFSSWYFVFVFNPDTPGSSQQLEPRFTELTQIELNNPKKL